MRTKYITYCFPHIVFPFDVLEFSISRSVQDSYRLRACIYVKNCKPIHKIQRNRTYNRIHGVPLPTIPDTIIDYIMIWYGPFFIGIGEICQTFLLYCSNPQAFVRQLVLETNVATEAQEPRPTILPRLIAHKPRLKRISAK